MGQKTLYIDLLEYAMESRYARNPDLLIGDVVRKQISTGRY